MFVIGLQIINWALILEKTKRNVYYLAQNIDLLKSIVLVLDIKRYTLSNVNSGISWLAIEWNSFWGVNGFKSYKKKINSKLRFLYRKNRLLSPPLCKLLYNSLIQPHFDYACSAWYPNQNKKLKSKFEILQSKCIRFCLNLNNRAHVRQNEFEKINWLPVNDCFEQIISSMSFKFCNNTRPP